MLVSILVDKFETAAGQVYTIDVTEEVDEGALVDVVWDRDGARAAPFLIIIVRFKNIGLLRVLSR